MEALIDNMLDFARGKLGEGIQLKKENANKKLLDSLHQVIREIKLISPHREIEINFHLEEGINCDTNRVSQLFSNLLSNANHHGDKDKPIKVSAFSSDDLFRLSVKNEGDPIPKTSLEHLFEPFYKEDENSNKQGLGLGLFIASEIAKAHDGSLEVKSTEEETNFQFEMKC
jgi:signal transduction histidine kinase